MQNQRTNEQMTVTYSDGSVEVQTEIREKLGF